MAIGRVLLLVAITVSIGNIQGDVPPNPSCAKYEEWICGTTCVETCDYKPTICTKDCRFGCFCKDGYIRQSNTTGSECVKPENCKKPVPVRKCCKNQEFNICGTPCPPACNDFSYPLPKPVKACAAICIAGCSCKEGFFRSGKKCVAPENCCNGENEQFNRCGTACPETCDYKPSACTRQCVQGCFCKSSDFVRKDNSTNSPCIPQKECPKKLVY